MNKFEREIKRHETEKIKIFRVIFWPMQKRKSRTNCDHKLKLKLKRKRKQSKINDKKLIQVPV